VSGRGTADDVNDRLVVDTRNWLPGRHVVIPPQGIEDVDCNERVVNVDVMCDTVQAAREDRSSVEHSRGHEVQLYRHYQRAGYWQ
jgi:hypothetical protein